MKRVPQRIEPFSTYLERRRKGPSFPVVVAGEFVFVSGLPPLIRTRARSTESPSNDRPSWCPIR